MGPFFTLCYLIKRESKTKYLQSIVVYYFLIKVRSRNVLKDKDKTCIYRLLSTTKNLKSEDHHGFTKNDITFKTSYLTFRHIYILIIQIKMFYLADIKSCGNFKNNKEIFFFYKNICICIYIYFLLFYEDICICNLFSVRNPKKRL